MGSSTAASISQKALGITLLLASLTTLVFSGAADSPSSPPTISPASSPPPSDSPAAPPSSPPSPSFNSPPAPPPSDLSPISPSLDDETPSPAPAPVGANSSHVAETNVGDLDTDGDGDNNGSSHGMSAGQKAGVAIAVIAGVCVVGVGALVYKKRKENIQRAEYGYAARREYL